MEYYKRIIKKICKIPFFQEKYSGNPESWKYFTEKRVFLL